MRVLHLFAGAGGGILADRLLGHECVGYVEIDAYCQAILKTRIADGGLDPAPIFGDVREFLRSGAAREYRGVADVVSGGFPCPAFSVAGKRLGWDDPRNLWPETIEVIREVRPRLAFLENVPGLLTARGPDGERGGMFARVLSDLAESGLDAQWCVLGADDVGAPHHRKRLWILADAQRNRYQGGEHEEGGSGATPVRRRFADQGGSWWSLDPADVADATQFMLDGAGPAGPGGWGQPADASSRPTQSDMGGVPDGLAAGVDLFGPAAAGGIPRVAKGIPDRVARLRAIGNGQVPVCAAAAWLLLDGE